MFCLQNSNKNSQQNNTENINVATETQNYIPNKVTVVNNVSLSVKEQEGLLKSVDEYMNEYKLPKGVENSYKIFIESRLNNSIKIEINPEDKYWDSRTTIYARKTNNVWQVDPGSGPWCTLEEFDREECF